MWPQNGSPAFYWWTDGWTHLFKAFSKNRPSWRPVAQTCNDVLLDLIKLESAVSPHTSAKADSDLRASNHQIRGRFLRGQQLVTGHANGVMWKTCKLGGSGCGRPAGAWKRATQLSALIAMKTPSRCVYGEAGGTGARWECLLSWLCPPRGLERWDVKWTPDGKSTTRKRSCWRWQLTDCTNLNVPSRVSTSDLEELCQNLGLDHCVRLEIPRPLWWFCYISSWGGRLVIAVNQPRRLHDRDSGENKWPDLIEREGRTMALSCCAVC